MLKLFSLYCLNESFYTLKNLDAYRSKSDIYHKMFHIISYEVKTVVNKKDLPYLS